GDQRLHVGGAAAVKVAALLEKLEGVASPVFALGLYHVQMAQQQNRLQVSVRARQYGNDAAFLRVARFGEQLDVARTIARLLEMAVDFLGQLSATAGGQRSVGLHHLLE